MLALKLEGIIAERAKERMLAGKADPTVNSPEGETRDEVAALAGISHDTIGKVKRIVKKASKEQRERIRRGETRARP